MKITAVCVEEEESGLVVLVAANAKDSNGSSNYLDTVEQGFDEVFKLLEKAPVCIQCYHRHVSQSDTQQSKIHQAWPETKHRYDIEGGKEGNGEIHSGRR
ncbi:hypothetical protein ACHAP7_004515 [Fusarium lateritium]